MLVNLQNPTWWYLEIPRTASTAIDRSLRQDFPLAKAAYPKHWPITPQPHVLDKVIGITSIRNPYSRAVSCWQFFTKPNTISFLDWLKMRLDDGFFEINSEARPQYFWFRLAKWRYILRQENLDLDYWTMLSEIAPEIPRRELPRVNDINGPWINKAKAKTHRDKPWQEYYCGQSIDNVKALYAADFEAFKAYYSLELPEVIS